MAQRKNKPNSRREYFPTIGDSMLSIDTAPLMAQDPSEFKKFIYNHQEITLVEKLDDDFSEVLVNQKGSNNGKIIKLNRGLGILKVGELTTDEQEIIRALRAYSREELEKVAEAKRKITKEFEVATKISKLYDEMESLDLNTPGKDIEITIDTTEISCKKEEEKNRVFIKEEDEKY
jgi:hypothetical protein